MYLNTKNLSKVDNHGHLIVALNKVEKELRRPLQVDVLPDHQNHPPGRSAAARTK